MPSPSALRVAPDRGLCGLFRRRRHRALRQAAVHPGRAAVLPAQVPLSRGRQHGRAVRQRRRHRGALRLHRHVRGRVLSDGHVRGLQVPAGHRFGLDRRQCE